MNDTDQRAHGACTRHDPAIFFAESARATRHAKAICAGCPIRSACLDRALARQEPYGVWGGTTAEERRRMHRRLKLPTVAKQRRDEKRKAARRMFAQGRGRTDIARFLHVSGSTVNRYLDAPAA